jgi:CDP-diacylglycerol pyrophosphatase
MFPEFLQSNAYQFMALSPATFRTTNLFRLIHRQAVREGRPMAFATLAVVNLSPHRFLLLAFGDTAHPVGAERLQDHSCSLAQL